ncbi:conserved hypothetical protein, partial [Ricinus communis]
SFRRLGAGRWRCNGRARRRDPGPPGDRGPASQACARSPFRAGRAEADPSNPDPRCRAAYRGPYVFHRAPRAQGVLTYANDVPPLPRACVHPDQPAADQHQPGDDLPMPQLRVRPCVLGSHRDQPHHQPQRHPEPCGGPADEHAHQAQAAADPAGRHAVLAVPARLPRRAGRHHIAPGHR